MGRKASELSFLSWGSPVSGGMRAFFFGFLICDLCFFFFFFSFQYWVMSDE